MTLIFVYHHSIVNACHKATNKTRQFLERNLYVGLISGCWLRGNLVGLPVKRQQTKRENSSRKKMYVCLLLLAAALAGLFDLCEISWAFASASSH